MVVGIPVRWSAAADTRQLLIGLVSMATAALANGQAWAQSNDPRSAADWLRLAAERLCPNNPSTGLEAQALLPDVWFLSEDVRGHRSGSGAHGAQICTARWSRITRQPRPRWIETAAVYRRIP